MRTGFEEDGPSACAGWWALPCTLFLRPMIGRFEPLVADMALWLVQSFPAEPS